MSASSVSGAATPAALGPVTATTTAASGATGGTVEDGAGGARGQVLAATRSGPLVRIGASVWLLEGGPRLDPGTLVRVRLGDVAGDGHRPARLLAVGSQRLDPPATLRALPAHDPAAGGPRQAPPAPGTEMAVRLLGPGHRPGDASFVVRLTALAADQSAGSPATATSATPPAAPPAGGPPATAAVIGAGQPSSPAGTVMAPPGVAAGEAAGARPGDMAHRPLASDPDLGPRSLDARVVHRDPLGRVWLQAGGRLLEVQTPLPLPLGARLRVHLPEDLAWPPARAIGPAGAGAVGGGSDPGERLRAAAAQGDLARLGLALPRPDESLAGRLLRWIAALDAAPGRGPMASDAEAGPSRPAATPAEPSRWASEPSAAGWRTLVLPWDAADGGRLRLLLPDAHAEDGSEGEAEGGAGETPRRAVFELELSGLGRVQLDALCHGRRFDLAVRTERPLEPELRHEVRALFEAACELGGFTGHLGFRGHGLLALSEPLPGSRHHLTV